MAPADSERQVTLIASGSEVQIALEAQQLLRAEGISAAVVSMPSWELFEQQPPHYRDEVLGPGTLHIAIEAAARSEEHTSELQSLMRNSYAVFCLKKKKQQH